MKQKKGYDLNRIMAIISNAVRTERNGFHASKGNSKTGKIAGWSVAPLYTCSMEACAHCGKGGCYAVKNMCCYGYNIEKNNVLKAWTENTALVVNDLQKFEDEMDRVLSRYKGRFYRIHPSGDFITVEYALAWCKLAAKYNGVQFLAFTKQWDAARALVGIKPDNLHIVASGWTGTEIPKDILEHYHASFCVGKGEEPPKDAIACPGSCETCNACWMLDDINKNVWFAKH